MILQNYLQTTRSLAKLNSLGDIRHLTGDYSEICTNALVAICASYRMVKIEGGVLPSSSQYLAGAKVESFAIGKYAVTNQEWQDVRLWGNANGFEIDLAESGSRSLLEISHPKHPVVGINWYDCLKWCNAKSAMEGLKPVYGVKGQQDFFSKGEYGNNALDEIVILSQGEGYRLPSIIEWEWAAQGGNKSQNYTFAGGNDINEVAWYSGNSEGKIRQVGLKKPNELNLYDMSGNIYEWCWVCEEKYEDGDTKYWCRGGGFDEIDCRISSLIVSCEPDTCSNEVGFRIAQNLK